MKTLVPTELSACSGCLNHVLGKGLSNESNTVRGPPPPASSRSPDMPPSASLHRATTSEVFLLCALSELERGWRGPDERDCGRSGEAAAGGGGGPLDFRPGCAEPTGPLWKPRRPPRARTAGRALCSGLPGGGCQPSDLRADPPASLCLQSSPN